MKRHTKQGILLITTGLIVGLVLLLISLGLYAIRTTNIPANAAVNIANPNSYIDNGLFAQQPYMQYNLTPTTITKPNATYRISVGNGIVNREDKVSWTKLELDIQKSKTIKHTLSQDEFTSIRNRSSFTMTTTEIRSEHNGSYLLMPVLYVALVTLGIMLWRDRKPQPATVQRIRTNTAMPKPAPTTRLTDDEQAKRCLLCPSLKAVNGVLRCQRQKCNYGDDAMPTPPRRTAPQRQLTPRPLQLPKIGPITQVFVIGIMTGLVGVGSLVFFARISQGPYTFQEPDRVILWGEIAFAAALTLGGTIMTVLKLREVK